MRIFRKYEFGSKAAATTKINALGVDADGNATHRHTIVRLGHITLVPAVYENEVETSPAVLAENYSVDVLWYGEPDPDWDNQMIWCEPIGVHTFGSSSAIEEWTRECMVQRPDLFPAPSDVPVTP